MGLQAASVHGLPVAARFCSAEAALPRARGLDGGIPLLAGPAQGRSARQGFVGNRRRDPLVPPREMRFGTRLDERPPAGRTPGHMIRAAARRPRRRGRPRRC